MNGLVLGIETSCDDTAVALVDSDLFVKASVFAHQNSSHAPFGGVVPEVASRAHSEVLLPLLDQMLRDQEVTWADIGAVAVTSRPGLIGSLLVGVVTAKTLALVNQKPLIGVNHIEAHLLSSFLKDTQYTPPSEFGFPFLGLAVSGGHTHLFMVEGPGRSRVLGQTRDDAAGEAFDKFAKLVGLGFPGGVRVDKAAQSGNPKAFSFPRGLIREDNLEFSFSGLKSAAARLLLTMSEGERAARLNDLCASYQAAIVDVLIAKLDRALGMYPQVKSVAIAGGVSANSGLRAQAMTWAESRNLTLALPPLRYCTDNAAMIAGAGLLHLQQGHVSDSRLTPSASSLPGDFQS